MLDLSKEELELAITVLNIGHEFMSSRYSDTWDALEDKDYSVDTLTSYRKRVGELLQKLETENK